MRKLSVTHIFLGLSLLACLACSTSDDSNPDDNNPNGPVTGNPNLNKGAVGESANDLLSANNYTSLYVEIQYAAGYAPPNGSISYLQSFLENHLNKPGGIQIETKEVSGEGKASYSTSDLRNFEDDNRTKFTKDNQLAVYFYFADGNYTSENVLGIAHRNTSMVLFQKRIEELSGGIGQASTQLLTSSVMAHEMGHIMGLVNVGTDMQTPHQDEANGKHCNVDECLMYYAVESAAGISDLLGMSQPPAFDDLCLADLRANGGK